MIPAGVTKGENWTGLLTRSTGSWDPALTSYIQTLLASMYTERGRWTMDLDTYRQPVMFHRDLVMVPAAGTAVIDPTAPGVKLEPESRTGSSPSGRSTPRAPAWPATPTPACR